MKVEGLILKVIEKSDVRLPRCNNKILGYIRVLNNRGLDDLTLQREYWSKRATHMIVGALISLLLVLGFKDNRAIGFLYGICILIYSFIGLDKELKRKTEYRRDMILRDFPAFINKVILLLETGLSLPRAWEYACESKDRDSTLYHEAQRVTIKIAGGYPFNRALEEFAHNLRVSDVSKFTSILLQNYSKGGYNLVGVLRIHGSEAWQMRKNVAKRLGNKAATKLVFPMIMIFIAVMLLVITPALLQLKGI